MNLREKFIWNVLVGFAFVSIGWFGWGLFNKNSTTNKLYDKYKNEQVGTDQSLQNKVNNLESVYKFRNENRFKVANNPFEVTRVLTGGSGSGNKGQIYTTGIFKLENGQFKAAVNFKGKTYTVIKGDLLEGGKIIEVNEDAVVWEKNGNRKTLFLNIGN
tara:strand:- start:939 stop:1415 length:477 start_codon:yes stop_codon:yes gene_type:complete